MKTGVVGKIMGLASVAALGIPAAAFAQGGAATAASQSVTIPKGYAASAFQVPTGGGSGWGALGVGLYGQTIDGASDDFDGSLGFNFGVGDPSKYVGLDGSLTLASITGANDSSFGEAGAFGLKLHTNLPGLVSVAVGVQGIGRFGDLYKQANAHSSVYAAASKFFVVGGKGLALTVGAGDGAFDKDDKGISPMGSLAFYLTPQISLIGEYTGRFTNVVVSAAPFPKVPLTVTLGAVNLGNYADLGTQFAASLGYGFSF